MAVLVSGRHAQAGPVAHHVPGLNSGGTITAPSSSHRIGGTTFDRVPKPKESNQEGGVRYGLS